MLLGTAVVVVGGGLDLLGLPSALLFGSLLVGLGFAVAAPGRIALPSLAFTAAQAVLGTVLGAFLEPSSLGALARDWLPVALVAAATLAISLGVSQAVARLAGIDRVTAALGLVAGGASGIVSMAEELGADDRLVAFMQYARVLIVVLATPLVVLVAFPGGEGLAGAPADGPLLGSAEGWALTALAALAGVTAGRLVRLPVAALLGPLLLAGAVTLADPGALAPPPLLREVAFAVIGVRVGLRFTPGAVRRLGRLVLPVLGAIVALMLACFGLAAALAATTSATLLDAYLATTPGGLYAVLAVAFGAGADTTFILAVQTLRLFVMILLAPPVARQMAGHAPGCATRRRQRIAQATGSASREEDDSRAREAEEEVDR
jgi:membrane AbrB-like protein